VLSIEWPSRLRQQVTTDFTDILADLPNKQQQNKDTLATQQMYTHQEQ